VGKKYHQPFHHHQQPRKLLVQGPLTPIILLFNLEKVEERGDKNIVAMPQALSIPPQGDNQSFKEFFRRFDLRFSRSLLHNHDLYRQHGYEEYDVFMLVLAGRLNIKWVRLLMGWVSDTVRRRNLAPEEIFRAGCLLEFWETRGFATYEWSWAVHEPLLTFNVGGQQIGPFPVWGFLRSCLEHNWFS